MAARQDRSEGRSMKMAAFAKKNGLELMQAQSNRNARSSARLVNRRADVFKSPFGAPPLKHDATCSSSALHNRATDLHRNEYAVDLQPHLVLISLCWFCEVQL